MAHAPSSASADFGMQFSRHREVVKDLATHTAGTVLAPGSCCGTSVRTIAPVERLRLVSGMAVTAEVHLGRRTVLEYLLSPLRKVAGEAGRER